MTVLFVCSGNWCRSPMAEAVARWYGIGASSAGTDARIPWKAMHPDAKAALRERLYPVAPHTPRPVTAELVASVELVVGMTGRHARRAEELGAARTLTWDVPDPVAGGLDAHRAALDLIEDAMHQVRFAAVERTGWRTWRFNPFTGAMCSPIRGMVPWRDGRNVARCLLARHAAPAPDCTCGITVIPDKAELVGWLRRFAFRGDRWVVGKVRYGGAVYPSPIDPPGTLRVGWAELVGALCEVDWEAAEQTAAPSPE